MVNQNIVMHPTSITKKKRQEINRHKSCVLWFTGYSGSGKSTLANELDRQLYDLKISSYVLDGDNIRHGLNHDLGFSANDRIENIRRVGEVAKLFVDSGTIVMTAFISPFQKDRDQVRQLFEDHEFIEVFVDCPFEICEQRDPKGLYRKARKGEIKDFTGIDSPYEPPLNPELTVETEKHSIKEAANQIIQYLGQIGMI
ncbi:putative adenylyl-sulfate kinase [Tenuibacillus multivorans]|uniref:Adenylyl-sulfate kinase n=2 Tax=Tenuibacillus multivorans TaxID=237069 RepID=A0A1H0CLB0_9BACI|nr:putative adenylyl-sulfate kinase [Tenuibacillus multivorans]SDN58677.1 adenylylsulfate kinase [Tenuibacillus multivorans]